ncbi:uncharacterized protein K02A2.6 [Trichonephila clavipes]|nr:uncharacterized protein K02A2.6 [Trichonephila clavipes]
MKVTTTKKTIECLRDSFARFGLPRVLVTDNGSQFTSYEFQRFMHKNGVRHKTSAPFKPSSNGQAERYVATLKQSLRAMHKYEDIRTRIDLLLPELKTEIQDKLRRDNFEFRDRKFDVGDRVAVRVYRAANTRWKFGTIVNQDGVLHYIIDVQGTLVRRHVDQIRPVGIKCKKTSFHLCTRDFHHQRFEKTTLIFSMQKRRKIFLRIGTRNWVHLPYKECHQLMLRFQIYHSLQLKETDSRRGVHQFQTGHFLGVPGESGGLRRDLFFKEGGDVVYLTVTS